MRDIVATVQREQDEIIRGPAAGVLVVQGGPGTGKTAVALHRAAYLLYTHRFPLERQGVLVVGPNPLFLRYIEHVLPSLGETGVELSTVPGLFGDVRPTAAETGGRGPPQRRPPHGAADRPRRGRPPAAAAPDRHGALRPAPAARSPRPVGRDRRAAKRRPGPHNARRRIGRDPAVAASADQLEPERRVSRPSEDDDGATGRAFRPPIWAGSCAGCPRSAEALDRMWPVLDPARAPPRPVRGRVR